MEDAETVEATQRLLLGEIPRKTNRIDYMTSYTC
jgi:hypothetical protein